MGSLAVLSLVSAVGFFSPGPAELYPLNQSISAGEPRFHSFAVQILSLLRDLAGRHRCLKTILLSLPDCLCIR